MVESLIEESVKEEKETRRPARDLNFRVWFWSFVAAMLAAVLLVRVAPSTGAVTWLVLFWVYMSLACTFLPLPTVWICLWLGTQQPAALVAFVGAIGTCVANLHDYYLLRFFLGYERIARTRETRFYEKAEAWFRRAPFLVLSVASFLPIPVDVVRLLAIASGYPRKWFVLATFAGRFPRYFIIAWLGHALKPSSNVILLVLFASILTGLVKVAPSVVRKFRRGKDPQ